MVDVKDKGPTNILDIKVNDYVRSGTNSFSKVFAFGQRNHAQPSRMTVIETTSETSPVITLTFDHMIFLEGVTLPVTAGSVKVGDKLASVNEDEAIVVMVTHNVADQGFVTPITTSGKIVVDGIVASSYAGKNGHSQYFPNTGNIFHYHTISHLATSPVRFSCKWVSESFCGDHFHHDHENAATSGQHVFFTVIHSAKHFVRSHKCGPVLHAVLFAAIIGMGLLFEHFFTLALFAIVFWYIRLMLTKNFAPGSYAARSKEKIL